MMRLVAAELPSLTTSADGAVQGASFFLPSKKVDGHTNFTVENVELNRKPLTPGKTKFTVSRNGDVLSTSYVVIRLPRVTAGPGTGVRWRPDVGLALIESASLVIGGQVMDRQTGEYMHVWNALTSTNDEAASLHDMMSATSNGHFANELREQLVYVPLNFTFCGDPGAALPLICLRFHEITLELDMLPLAAALEVECNMSERAPPTFHGSGELAVDCDFVYLECNERRRLAQGMNDRPWRYALDRTLTHTFRVTGDAPPSMQDLPFEGHIAELIITCRRDLDLVPNRFCFADNGGVNPVRGAVLTFGDRGAAGLDLIDLTGKYMHSVLPWRYHTGRAPPGVNVFSFALRPEDSAPSGDFYASSDDDARALRLKLDLVPGPWIVTVYARTRAAIDIAYGTATLVIK